MSRRQACRFGFCGNAKTTGTAQQPAKTCTTTHKLIVCSAYPLFPTAKGARVVLHPGPWMGLFCGFDAPFSRSLRSHRWKWRAYVVHRGLCGLGSSTLPLLPFLVGSRGEVGLLIVPSAVSTGRKLVERDSSGSTATIQDCVHPRGSHPARPQFGPWQASGHLTVLGDHSKPSTFHSMAGPSVLHRWTTLTRARYRSSKPGMLVDNPRQHAGDKGKPIPQTSANYQIPTHKTTLSHDHNNPTNYQPFNAPIQSIDPLVFGADCDRGRMKLTVGLMHQRNCAVACAFNPKLAESLCHSWPRHCATSASA